MSTPTKLPAPPADETEADDRLSTYMTSWRSSMTSTEPADRATAEAAIDGLYRNIGRAAPRIVWVPSPLVGALAYQTIGSRYGELISPYATGDVGTGENRDFYGLRDPFGFPAYVERTVPERLRHHAASHQASAIQRARDAATRSLAAIRAELTRQIPLAISDQLADPTPVDFDERLGELLIGSSAEPFSRLVGREVFSMMAGQAVRQAFVHQMRIGRTPRVTQAMQPGFLDGDALHLTAIEEVFGRPFYSPRNGSVVHEERLALRLQLARSAGPWWALDGLAIVSERHLVVALDEQGRLHDERGPALAFGDGFVIHAWHGLAVDRWVIESPEKITVEAIDDESNAELRRVLVERYGLDRLVRGGSCQLRHEDKTGRLWERPMGTISWRREDEPLVFLEVLNSTPEADGSRKTYFLRVPPATRTAREGVAWTFGLGATTYMPAIES